MKSATETAEKPDTNPFTEPVYRAAVRSRFAEQGIDQIIWIRNERARCDFEVTPRITRVGTGSRLTNSAASTDTRIGTLSSQHFNHRGDCYDHHKSRPAASNCLGRKKGRTVMKIAVIGGTSRRGQVIQGSKRMVVLAFLITSTLLIPSALMADETITPLMSKDLAGLPAKEVLMYTVDFPAGFSSPVHRHNAQVSVYVLKGSVVMQVRGGQGVTLTPGQSFYENPNDIHVVSRNASSTKTAKFLVFLIHKKGAPLVIPAK